MRRGIFSFAMALCLGVPIAFAVEQAKKSDSFVDSIGVNTHYGNSIYTGGNAYQNAMYAAVKGDPLTASRTIYSPAMGTSSNSQYLVPINFDIAAMHSYPSGREPTFNLDTFISQMATLRGSKPLASTETGY